MAVNPQSSSGMAEDIIRAFTQVGCAESHAKTLLEKATAELDNGLVDVVDKDMVEKQVNHINDLIDEIASLAELRRDMMRYLQKLYPDGDKSYWCMVKHLACAQFTAFEVYQASDDDPDLLNMALEANKRFVKALTHFLGVEITDCAACFADATKGVKDGLG